MTEINAVSHALINRVPLKIKMLHPEALLPTRATSGSAGFDLYTIEDVELKLIPGGTTVRTGIAVELPPGYEIQIRGRSGLAFRDDIIIHFGTIDQDYRGEIRLRLWNLGAKPKWIKRGERVAQMIVKKTEEVCLIETSELERSERGSGGFGHTGR